VVIASYLDLGSSLKLATQILHEAQNSACIIVDDSPVDIYTSFEKQILEAKTQAKARLSISHSSLKAGRGRAVRRGLKLGLQMFPSSDVFIEMDGDGSHRKQDVLALLRHKGEAEIVIGSRYLESSHITGWSFGRKLLSRVLNFVLPRLLGIKVSDITNGLRRYSRRNVQRLLEHEPITDGFIYLSETLALLKEEGTPAEIPIVFENRSQGQSSVGLGEMWDSFRGLLRILRIRKW